MNSYGTSKIRNVCLLGHGGSGKTTLAEAMLFNSGASDRLGKVSDGTTTTDYDQEEVKRKFSINAAMAPCEWKGYKINVIDAPGYFDFYGEVNEAVRASDGAVIVMPAKEGIAVGTEMAWNFCTQRGIPKVLFVNKMDEENVDFYKKLAQIEAAFGSACVPIQLPITENGKYAGFIEVLSKKAMKFDKGKLVEASVPSNLEEALANARTKIMEVVAETDEELMDKYFSGEEFTDDELRKGLILGMKECRIAPIYCGSSLNNQGVEQLMDGITRVIPSPEEGTSVKAVNDKGESVELKADPNGPFAAFVFKTIADPFVGRISIFRVYSGTAKNDMTVINSTTKTEEKLNNLFMLRGKKQVNTDKITAGDIGAVAKLLKTNTNDTLCGKNNVVEIEKIVFPEPCISLSAEPKSKGDEDKISSGFNKLQDEDPTFKVSLNTETHQTIISGLGEQHLDVICSKLQSKYGVSVNLSEPKVAYRETIKKKVKVEGKHKKQSGGHGQYGHVWIEFEPNHEKEELVFEEKVFGGAVPRNFFPAVEKGLQDSVKKGVLAGYPVVNLKATLLDGSYHPVDSSEMAFKVAANLAYKKGMVEAGATLLEPIVKAEIYIPEKYMGDVIGDLNKRRGRILGMNPMDNGIQQVVAEVPQAEMTKYATDLRSMTQARGSFTLTFERYEEAPASVAQKVIEAAKKDMSEEAE